MQIRGITKTDYDHVVSVLDRWWGGPSREQAHPIFFYELGEHALIADDEGEVIGFLLGFLAPSAGGDVPHTAYVHLVGIHPEHRRRGVGKRLYEVFVERARQAGAQRVKAITNVGNEGSIEFHRALGFAVVEDHDYAGPNRTRIVFTKML
ncbi:GNAT family N-acetyltransferase [Sandaracinus amylolyticus]|uniref:GNAT family N-acetyltransferase n=1 Tax=Sandaracinus amylolyticus TaxID=927083 RepID=UPI001F28D52C|nr:GNAT family N-acetyltransferase [Sandaracinus amylolyticus]UJR81609.1 N-acetyltransferase [Sandaracinus amylolyticus]